MLTREKKHKMELELTCPLHTRVHRALQSNLFSDFPICTLRWITNALSLCPEVHPFIYHIFDSPGGLGASADSRVLQWEQLDAPQTLSNTAALQWVKGRKPKHWKGEIFVKNPSAKLGTAVRCLTSSPVSSVAEQCQARLVSCPTKRVQQDPQGNTQLDFHLNVNKRQRIMRNQKLLSLQMDIRTGLNSSPRPNPSSPAPSTPPSPQGWGSPQPWGDPDYLPDSQASPCFSIKSRATRPARAPRQYTFPSWYQCGHQWVWRNEAIPGTRASGRMCQPTGFAKWKSVLCQSEKWD